MQCGDDIKRRDATRKVRGAPCDAVKGPTHIGFCGADWKLETNVLTPKKFKKIKHSSVCTKKRSIQMTHR